MITEAERALLIEHATWIGPVVDEFRTQLETMRPLPLCVVCPAAQWYRIEDEKGAKRVEAYCTEFRGTMYDHRQRAVTACDARDDAIARDRKQAGG